MLVVAAFVLVLYSRPAGTVIMINRNRTYGKRDPIAARPGRGAVNPCHGPCVEHRRTERAA